jgi:hypothetical protein
MIYQDAADQHIRVPKLVRTYMRDFMLSECSFENYFTMAQEALTHHYPKRYSSKDIYNLGKHFVIHAISLYDADTYTSISVNKSCTGLLLIVADRMLSTLTTAASSKFMPAIFGILVRTCER